MGVHSEVLLAERSEIPLISQFIVRRAAEDAGAHDALFSFLAGLQDDESREAYLQQVLDFGAFAGGSALLPMTVTIMVLMILVAPRVIGRFGFKADERLKLPDVPAEYFQCLTFGPDIPEGDVAYHSAFAI